MSVRRGVRGAFADRAIAGVYRYGGPLRASIDVALRRRRLALLLRAAGRGEWAPKHGLERARGRGPAFRREVADRVLAAVRRDA